MHCLCVRVCEGIGSALSHSEQCLCLCVCWCSAIGGTLSHNELCVYLYGLLHLFYYVGHLRAHFKGHTYVQSYVLKK